uniref:universal stress protein n=1 Tax=Planomicrobium okeanokoites TaxID=244 RepID=UPI0035674FDA
YDKNSAKRSKIEARDLLAKHKQEAEAAGGETVNVIVEYGVTKSVIPKEIAERTGADLIICGATGLTGAERIIMGSISQSIVRFAKCDVLVVRTEEDAARQEQLSE